NTPCEQLRSMGTIVLVLKSPTLTPVAAVIFETFPIPLSVTQMLVPSNGTSNGMEPGGSTVCVIVPVAGFIFEALSDRLLAIQMLVPSKAPPSGLLPAVGKVPALAGSWYHFNNAI